MSSGASGGLPLGIESPQRSLPNVDRNAVFLGRVRIRHRQPPDVPSTNQLQFASMIGSTSTIKLMLSRIHVSTAARLSAEGMPPDRRH